MRFPDEIAYQKKELSGGSVNKILEKNFYVKVLFLKKNLSYMSWPLEHKSINTFFSPKKHNYIFLKFCNEAIMKNFEYVIKPFSILILYVNTISLVENTLIK